MPGLFRRAFFKFHSLHNHPGQRRFLHPWVRAFRRSPQIPVGLKHVGIIIVQKFRDFRHRFFRRHSRTVAVLQNRRLAPRHRLDRRIRHSAVRRGKRNLPQNTYRARQDLGLLEAREPQAQIKGIGHECILNGRRIALKKIAGAAAPAAGFDAAKMPCYYEHRRQTILSPGIVPVV